ncbi:MAG: glutaredoxin family protein [Acidobacteria bacterium]|nr:glutaredoxin family protein [Acidobacteriota bacterium]
MAKVTLYTRQGCCLCEDAKRVLEAARARAVFELEEVDIDRDARLRARYDHEVPVIVIDGKKAFKYRVNAEEFLKKLGARR